MNMNCYDYEYEILKFFKSNKVFVVCYLKKNILYRYVS